MDDDWKRYLQLAASGALTGAGMGAIGKLLGGSRSVTGILGAGALGAATGGSVVPAAAYLGERVMGAPEETETQPYTLRAALGGAGVGALGGAIGGGLLGSGASAAIGNALPGVSQAMHSAIPLDNLLVDKIRKMGGLKGAGLGALIGAGVLGYMSGDEGQQIDTIRNLAKGNTNVSG